MIILSFWRSTRREYFEAAVTRRVIPLAEPSVERAVSLGQSGVAVGAQQRREALLERTGQMGKCNPRRIRQ